MRGQDRFALSLYSFLGRAASSQQKIPDEVLQGYCYRAFPKWRQFFIEKLVAAYFVKVRRYLLECCHEQEGHISGDVVHFDCSRVSCKDVMLVTQLVGGSLLALPLQVLPDQSSVIDGKAAIKVVNDQMASKGRKKQSEYRSTRLQFLALAHAMLFLWPFESMLAWKATAVDRGGDGSQRAFDILTGHYYRVVLGTGRCSWCLPRELRHPGDS